MNQTVGGLDIDALVSATIQAASLPVVLLQNKNAKLQAQLNDYNTIKSALNTLKYALTDLTYSSAFTGRKATSTDEKVVTASSQNGSANGSYVINVTSMATVTSNTSAILGHAATKANVTGTQVYTGALSTGSFTINGKTINVAATDTRDEVITKINAASAGVTASVASDGTVSITQNTAGATPTITLGADTSDFLSNAGITQGGVASGADDSGSAGSKAYITGDVLADDFNSKIDGVTIKAGTFYINSKRIDVTSTDTINTIVNKITASGAGVTATVSGDKVTITQNTAGKTPTISLGSDTTGFLSKAGITSGELQQGIDPDQKLNLKDLFGTGNTAGLSGYFSINGTFFSVDPNEDSIDSIVKKINSSTTAGVTAVYNSSTGTMSLTSQVAGAKEIKLGTNGTTDDSNFLSKVGLIQGNQVTGKDAAVTVNGLSVTPVNNKVTFNNNTFTLVGTGTATVTVEDDVDSIVTKVQAFVTAYNSAIDAVYSKYNEGEGKNLSGSSDVSVGDLFGDPLLGSLNTMMRSMTSSLVKTQPAGYQQLSQIGITTGKPGVYDIDQVKSGHLELDTDKLKAALKSNTNAVASLLGNTTQSVPEEIVTLPNAPDGTTKTFALQHGEISGDHRVFVDGIEYTEVTGTPKPYSATPNATQSKNHEYSIDYKTGKITFGDAPLSGQSIKVSYSYDISATSSSSGLFIQMKAKIESSTKFGGQFDSIIGTDGSITKGMKYNNDRISDLQLRLAAKQATLYTKYQNMQTILASLQSQGTYLTALLSSLNSSSSK
jgi:flagellar hook-associated protein 2